MRIEQSADNMMKTPVPMVTASIDLTSSPPFVVEYLNQVIELEEPKYLDKIIDRKTSNDGLKISYYLTLEALKQEILLLNEVLFTPKNTCYTISTEIIDEAPLRVAMNADIHGYFVWGSRTISYWQSNTPSNKYYIVRKPYNIDILDRYIVFGKTDEWIRKVREKLESIPIDEVYPRRVLVVEGDGHLSKDLVFTQEVSEVDVKVLEAITFNIGASKFKEALLDYLKYYYSCSSSMGSIGNSNVLIGLEKLYGMEKVKILISKILTSCNEVVNENEILEVIALELSLTKNLARNLLKDDRKAIVNVYDDKVIVKGIRGSSIVELEVISNDEAVGKHMFLVDENHEVVVKVPYRDRERYTTRYKVY